MSTVRLKPDRSRNWGGGVNGETPTKLPRESMEQRQDSDRQQQQQQQQEQKQEGEPKRYPPPVMTRTADGFGIHVTSPISEAQDSQSSQGWDSTIGKAGLGKTGRVINKLVSDNEALKRDIKIERLKSEEAKQAAKLTGDKMDRLIQDYESRLLEANVTKTLLSRKERQVESLTAAIEIERNRATSALNRERTWREEMETARHDAKIRVEEAAAHVQLVDGRYNVIVSHWDTQGEVVNRAAAKLRVEISTLVEERRKDDEKIMQLRELCDQQDSSIKDLVRQKEEIARQFDAYKQGQEDWLKDVKANAHAREAEQERLLQESRETLAKLRWALNVKENVRGAQ
ncbi:related to putative cytoplasmic structural protein [Cephalotrichum gorgonifer]|uniref:Related to putative cytoplasmic structural protein n=1 Tax=Cephalotrichum gorgonifer TaxID=2041049 RepID=A0AAE8MX85_9PEZI|nr:related to putative cytoplasmic structural protein [Cephalotrichum gorgonifer]